MSEIATIYDQFVAQVNAIDINTTSAVYRLLLSMVLGSVVGYERKRKGQIAGVRTFSLIAMGATLAMILSIYVPQEYLGLKNGDPGRIAAQVVTGVGFLGAGAIIQMRGSIRGLTTAAGIWMVAAIGMAVGVGMYWVSILATLLILFILVQLERFEHRINIGSESRIVRITLDGIVHDMSPLLQQFKNNSVTVTNYFIECDYEQNRTQIDFVTLAKENTDYLQLFAALHKVASTRSVALTNQVSI